MRFHLLSFEHTVHAWIDSQMKVAYGNVDHIWSQNTYLKLLMTMALGRS